MSMKPLRGGKLAASPPPSTPASPELDNIAPESRLSSFAVSSEVTHVTHVSAPASRGRAVSAPASSSAVATVANVEFDSNWDVESDSASLRCDMTSFDVRSAIDVTLLEGSSLTV
jgi:hypothetical protein